MRGIWKKQGEVLKVGKLPGESQVECHFAEFPRGETILGVLEMPGALQKQQRAAATTTQLAQKL